MERGRPRKSTAVADNRIKEMRKARGWTIEDLAERVNLTPGTVGRHENGDRDVSQKRLLQYAAAFECDVHDLLPPSKAPPDPLATAAHDLFAGMTPDQRRAWVEMGQSLKDAFTPQGPKPTRKRESS